MMSANSKLQHIIGDMVLSVTEDMFRVQAATETAEKSTYINCGQLGQQTNSKAGRTHDNQLSTE